MRDLLDWHENASSTVDSTVRRGAKSGSCGAPERQPILRLPGRALEAQVGCPDGSPFLGTCETRRRSSARGPRSVLTPNNVAEQQVRVLQELWVC